MAIAFEVAAEQGIVVAIAFVIAGLAGVLTAEGVGRLLRRLTFGRSDRHGKDRTPVVGTAPPANDGLSTYW